MTIAFRTPMLTAMAAMATALGSLVAAHADDGRGNLQKINHIVIIYQENHSFDNLYGGWEGVDGLDNALVPQVDQKGAVLDCLGQNDVNLASPNPFPENCANGALGEQFRNKPFSINKLLPFTYTTCPPPGVRAANGIPNGYGLRGGCTRDIVHRFYQEQYQIDDGKMDRYAAGSDAMGLVMGYYDTKALPIYAYLHQHGHPRYVIADNFLQAAFGGSFLNHQWLIAANTPEWTGAVNDGSSLDQHAVVDADGMPENYPLYVSPARDAVKDTALTASCAPASHRGPTPAGVVCGDFAVNTIQPKAWPYDPGAEEARRLPPLTKTTIGDLLTTANIDWAWYSGGWANAVGDKDQLGYTNHPRYIKPNDKPTCPPTAIEHSEWPNCPDKLFQFHHQPFNYYAKYLPGTDARTKHLRDEEEVIETLDESSKKKACLIRPVSFVKPLGFENEHPGYASERIGNDHLVKLIKLIEDGPCARDTMVIVTYDEFGGQADHVAPPSAGNSKGPYDKWGPGTRIPALILAPNLPKEFAVDHELHDTTSILATIEHRFGLPPLGSRDAAVKDLTTVFTAGSVK